MELKPEKQESLKNCFTCLRRSEEYMQISSEASNLNSVTIVELLTKHFWFQQEDFIEEQKVICWSCWKQLDEFHRFYQEVEHNHRALNQEPPEIGGCKVEPKLTEDEDFNEVDEIQHEEIEVKEEHWVEFEDKGTDDQSKFEFYSDEENSDDDDREPEDAPSGKLVPQHCEAKQKSWIREPARHAYNPYKDIKQWVDDEALIKAHVQYICSVCKNNCPTFNQLKVHMLNEHEIKGCLTCCGKKYYKKLGLLEHVQRLQDPNRFNCDVCHKNFVDSSAVRRHKRELHATDEEKMYRCDRCPKRFVRASLLLYHLKGHDNLKKGTFKCLHCERHYPTVGRMNRHIKVAHSSSVCDVLESGFPTSQGTPRVISQKLRVQCDICLKWLKNNHAWKMHYRRHTDPIA